MCLKKKTHTNVRRNVKTRQLVIRVSYVTQTQLSVWQNHQQVFASWAKSPVCGEEKDNEEYLLLKSFMKNNDSFMNSLTDQ